MIKSGVDLRGLKPQLTIAYVVACMIYYRQIHEWATITSASDGVHGPNSLHYSGNALDIRTRMLTAGQKENVYKQLRIALGEQFDVILEADHIHIEFDPKDGPGKDGD